MGKKIVSLWMMAMFLICSASMAYDRGQGAGLHCEKSGHYGKSGLENRFFSNASWILASREELKLTEDQISAIETIKHQARKNLIRSGAEIKIIMLDLGRELEKSTVDQEAVKKLIVQKYEIKKQKALSLAGNLVELRAVLTQEQRDQLEDL